MSTTPVEVRRPQRWDQPFDERPLSDRDVEWVLTHAPFSEIDEDEFTAAASLRDILKNDTRIVRCLAGDIVYRTGDYGTSAYFVLTGQVRVVLDRGDEALTENVSGSVRHTRRNFKSAVSQLWKNAKSPERRDFSNDSHASKVRSKGLFVQDVPAVLNDYQTTLVGAGHLFGELSALGRTPRTTTIFADDQCELLEIRWQGLRDLCRRSPSLNKAVDELYRKDALDEQLESTPILANVDAAGRKRLVDETVFSNYGNREWTATYKALAEQDAAQRLKKEPIIAEEGHYPNGLILIRSGFARVSRQFGNGHRTLSYLGKGQMFGLEEIYHNWRSSDPLPYRFTLRTVGYVDVLMIPTRVIEEVVLPNLPEELIPDPPVGSARDGNHLMTDATSQLRTQHLEQLVEARFINGTATMMIDLERCTRCDDCVRACASTHDGNPRFIRHGAQVGKFMIANACMHCVDPVCMIGCPTGAIQRASLGGEVTINDPTCIGCGTCATNCPYDNIRLVEARDSAGALVRDKETRAPIQKATKCDLCVDQQVGPACQNACPHDALKRVDMRQTKTLLELLER
ncbi:MAG: Fe-S-cluster-containing dehydrogenase component/CRP-like cAMP-binding protein [Myxococcota bacterium]|jgi:Fe-S-cluster-containing dehydrogenase component/CRP-like cAMP-binding protein